MTTANSMALPMASSTKLSKYGSNHVSDPTFFRSVVGGLQYATVTRPEEIRYLQDTIHHGLLIKPAPKHEPMSLIGFCERTGPLTQMTQVPQVFCDNLSAVSLAHNPVLHSRTKHMELDIFFIRENVINKSLKTNGLIF